jgi:hypothetical protein
MIGIASNGACTTTSSNRVTSPGAVIIHCRRRILGTFDKHYNLCVINWLCPLLLISSLWLDAIEIAKVDSISSRAKLEDLQGLSYIYV